MKIKIILSALLGALSFWTQQKETPVGKVIIQNEGDMAVITGEVVNPGKKDCDLKYRLHTYKSGQSGTSNNSQGSNISLKAGEKTKLSTSKMNVLPGDSLYVSLVLMDSNDDTLMIDNYTKIYP